MRLKIKLEDMDQLGTNKYMYIYICHITCTIVNVVFECIFDLEGSELDNREFTDLCHQQLSEQLLSCYLAVLALYF